MRLSPIVILLASACAVTHGQGMPDTRDCEVDAPLPDYEEAPAPSVALEWEDLPDTVAQGIDSYFDGHGTHRLHVQLDRPLYRPGETVWLKTWDVRTRSMDTERDGQITYELVNPRGQVVETKALYQQKGVATNDFTLDASAPGGKWTLKATSAHGEVLERPFVVSNYQAPRIQKTLEFVREAYGPGDTVEALVELEKGTGGPLVEHEVRALMQVDGETVFEEILFTDITGAVMVSADLPQELRSGDGLLTVLVEDGGVTESISRSVPIVLANLKLAFFPEGGDLVRGLPARVYFEGSDRHGEPADVKGFIQDDRGEWVADFGSTHDGMGRFAFTPRAKRTYTAHITSPEGIADTYSLPEARREGCTVRSYDDVRTLDTSVRVAVRCSEPQDVVVASVLRESTLNTAAVEAGPNSDTVVYLEPAEGQGKRQGAVRVTVFDWELNPLAERLVYRNPGKDLQIEIKPEKERYGPRDEVVVDIKTTDGAGNNIAAEVALSVVDDAVINLADDEEGHMLTRMYLEPELHESPEDPGWYFENDNDEGARGLDLVMGTKGWRHFEWQQVWHPEPVVTIATGAGYGRRIMRMNAMDEMAFAPEVPMMANEKLAAQPMAVLDAEAGEWDDEEGVENMEDIAWGDAPMEEPMRQPKAPIARKPMARDRRAQRDMPVGLEELGYLGYLGYREVASQSYHASVRVFPKPDYSGKFDGVRNDFRDTIHWEPSVVTDKWGNAEVRFYLSDAVTSFRVTAEGIGGGMAGHGEQTLTSVLPVSIATKLPAAVSAGDRLVLPVTVSNTRDEWLDVDLAGTFGSLLQPEIRKGELQVAPDKSDTFWMPLVVGEGNGMASIGLQANGGGLSDALERQLRVVPTGFPLSWSAAGELDKVSKQQLRLGEVVPNSLTAEVSWHPSTIATMMTGMEGLIRSPGGCFEQTSSTNWPNVAILNYLEVHNGDPRLRMQSSQALDVGYKKLSGYQVGAGGFETWGSGPGKEALSAFGLLQFADMKKVYPVADSILKRDVDYLLAQRDGKGGFKNSGESSHGYGSAPAPVLNGFITYSLVATGHGKKLDRELSHQADVSRTSSDPYVLALAARSLSISNHPAADKAIARLVELQAEDGSFPGAESSITRSYEANLVVESTALAAMAVMEGGSHHHVSDKAANWLVQNRQGTGTWGATQATALALAALSTHAEQSRAPRENGQLFLEVNGKLVGQLKYKADQTGALSIDGWEEALEEGDNKIVLRQEGGSPLPFTVDVSWKALNPASEPGAELSLETSLDKAELQMGETTRLTAVINNRVDRIVPSPIARIGLPAGLEAQTWQLEQLQERGDIAFFETRPREVTLYWDGIHLEGTHEVNLDLVAMVPGTFTGPASSAYPYYNDDEKAWDNGLKVAIGH